MRRVPGCPSGWVVRWCRRHAPGETEWDANVAARLLYLQAPGTALFPLAAPSWRQQRVLAG